MNAPTCAFRRRANRCLREAKFAELGNFFYLWVEQSFSYGDSDAGPMISTGGSLWSNGSETRTENHAG